MSNWACQKKGGSDITSLFAYVKIGGECGNWYLDTGWNSLNCIFVERVKDRTSSLPGKWLKSTGILG
jgi:hypothetical protein